MKLTDVLACGVLFTALGLGVGYGVTKWQQPAVTPAVPVAPVAGPSVQATSIATKLTGFPKQAKQLSYYFGDFAKVLKVSPEVSTTGEFRAANSRALSIFVAGTGYAGAPAVSGDLNAHFLAVLGEKDVPLGDKRATLISELEGLSRAFAAVK